MLVVVGLMLTTGLWRTFTTWLVATFGVGEIWL